MIDLTNLLNINVGEMSPEELWNTTLNPETRILHKVIYNPEGDDKTMFTFMSKTDGAIADRLEVILSKLTK